MPGKVKQRDITDCGAACLASIAMHHGIRLPVARIRQMACTDKKGTNVLGMVEAAQKMGFTAKGVKGGRESLSKIPLPAIAHVAKKNGLHHFVVVAAVTEKHISIMDPADGHMHKRPQEAFLSEWTGVLILIMPGNSIQHTNKPLSNSKRFLGLVSPHKLVIVQAMTGAVLFAVLGLASAIYVGRIVDNVLPTGNVNLLNLLGIAMIMVVVFRLLLNTFQMHFVLKTGQKIDATLILGYYKHILRLPQSFFDTMRVGEIISRVNDAVKVRLFINDIAINLVVNSLILIVSFALMFTYYWKLALVMLTVIPLYALVYAISNRLNKKVQRRVMERAADLESQLVESLTAASTIKRFGLEWFSNLKTEIRFTGLLSEVYTSGMNGIFSSNATSFLTQGFTIILLWIGTGYALSNQISPGELLSFYAILGYFTGPVSGIIGFNRSLQDALIASDRLFEIFDLQPDCDDGNMELQPNHITSISMKDISFRYGTRVQVFESLNLDIPVKKITAIVGESGSGKSTLASLLQNIYPIQKGRIMIGAFNINTFSNASLRRHISVVPQKIDLFSGNVIENIAVGELHPDMERLLSTCNLLGISQFIEQLPQGIHTHLGENGASLSGGQKQRIAIARALYRDSEVLILDEATSSLDKMAEKFVHDTLDMLRSSGKTIIIIAHRLSTIQHADHVVVLDEGRVVQQGNINELITEEGRFRNMFVENC
jgi:ATP-binding cassette, subfamily C, bacteriocin exporter